MKLYNLFGKSMVCAGAVFALCGANAADNGRAGVMSGTKTSPRMVVSPTVGLTAIGNPAVVTVNEPPQADVVHTTVDTKPVVPDPKPSTKCPDGGIENSEYTISMCMNDILQCVNTGALQGGLNDLFNEDVRNSIMDGMKLCQAQIDKCIRDVRVDCRNVYNMTTDVWLDFNSRIVQPEYYNFVLRRTGLTPNQAENTCLLLDRNTYGSSFAAVSDTDVVNNEYNKKVGAYNEASNGSLSKDNPQGVAVNTVGYDGNRGHYARWDAARAECLIRVAAYNKDKLITNSWLFGAIGNENPAEVWEKTGSTFTCSKDLFDFSLMNDTKTTAVVGVGGGTLLGTAIGAAAGAGAYEKKAQAENNPCSDEEYRRKLGAKINDSHLAGVLNIYAYESVEYKDGNYVGTKMFAKSGGTEQIDFLNPSEFTAEKCRKLEKLWEKLEVYKLATKNCDTNANRAIAAAIVNCGTDQNGTYQKVELREKDGEFFADVTLTVTTENATEQTQTKECRVPDLPGLDENTEDNFMACSFVPLQLGLINETVDVPNCTKGKGMCVSIKTIKEQMADLENMLNAFGLAKEKADKGAEIGKGIAIGATTGAAAGGLATAITAFVEKNNITCKVGDGLNSVALGKTHTIDSLKDFYVKWNLHLPDTVSPTSAVSTKADWEQACGQFNNKLVDCPRVQINLKDKAGKYTLVPSACRVSGSICIVNDSVMTSHGIK